MLFFKRKSRQQQRNKGVPVAVATPVIHPTKDVVSTTTTITTRPTPPGYNKDLRDITKITLLISAFLLLAERSQLAFILSIIACWIIHNGTALSIKNWKWTGASWYSLVLSGSALFNHWCMSIVDQEKAYGMYIIFQIFAKGCELFGSVMLLLWLFLAWNPTPSPS